MQEIAFARKITVIHGRRKIPWRDFRRVAEDYILREEDSNSKLLNDYPILSKAIELVFVLGEFQDNYSTSHLEPQHPLQLALESGSSKATDLRDKIYALRGLFTKEFQELVVPNYATPLTEVLIGVANALVLADKNLEVLKRATPAIRRPGLPSWVPDINESEDQWGAGSDDLELWSEWRFYKDEDANSEGYRSQTFVDDGVPVVRIVQQPRLLIRGLKVSNIRYLSDHYVDELRTVPQRHTSILSCLYSWYSIVRQHEAFKSDNINRLPDFCSACLSQLRTPLWSSTSLRKRAHGWSGLAFELKYYCFRSNHEFMSDHSESEEKRRKMSTRAARAIRAVASVRADPQAALQTLPLRLKSAQVLQRKDEYPIVPVGSDAESISVEGNISSSVSSAASITPPDSASSTWSSASDSSDPFTKRWWKKAKPTLKKKVQKPARNWARFARKEYARGREASKPTAARQGTDTSKAAAAEDHAASDAGPESEGEQNDDVEGDSEIRTHGVQSEPEAIAHTSRTPIETEKQRAPTAESKTIAPIRPLLVRQQSISNPCFCTMNDIDYLHHLTPAEDARLFNPKDSSMTHKGAERFFRDSIELDAYEQLASKKFGWIEIPRGGVEQRLARDIKGDEKAGIAMGMFPLGARLGDVVALVRGLRFPCVLREVGAGEYEWVGPCYVDRLWDWENLEFKVKEGGIGVENLVEFSLA